MNMTLDITFPPFVQAWIQKISGLVSFNIFQFPGVGCLATTSYYVKMVAQLMVPVGMAALFMVNYAKTKIMLLNELRELGHDPHDGKKLKAVEEKKAAAHTKKRQEGRLQSRNPDGTRKEMKDGVVKSSNPQGLKAVDSHMEKKSKARSQRDSKNVKKKGVLRQCRPLQRC